MKKGFLDVEVAESHLPSAWLAGKRACLESGEMAAPFHYATARQANLWMALFRRYSPFSEEQGRELYRRTARETADLLPERPAQLVSLGCGTAEKDLLVYEALGGRSSRPDWVCVDGSLPLLLEAGQRARSRAERYRLVLADVVLSDLLHRLAPREGGTPRLVTAFGLIPNLTPADFLAGLRGQLAAQDRLLLGANLAPVAKEDTQSYWESATRILPQYANPQTRLWLTEVLRDWGLRDMVDGYAMNAVRRDGWIRYEATVRWKRNRKLSLEDGSSVSVLAGALLRLFASYRFTLEGVARLLRANGFEPLCHWTLPSGEEGIWLAAPSSPGVMPTT